MKTFLFLIVLSLPAIAEVTLQDCQDDALLYGNHKNSVQPMAECAGLVQNAAGSVSVISSDNRYKAYGSGKMVYVETYDENNVLIDRSLLAGDQTELVSVEKIFIDVAQKRLLLIQLKNNQKELMVHKLDFIGNVSPLKVMRAGIFSSATDVRYNGSEEMEVVSGGITYGFNADAESRDELSTKKALTLQQK